MSYEIKKQLNRIVFFMVAVVLVNVFFYACKKEGKQGSFTNQPPVAKAGPDISTYPTNKFIIDGSGSSDPNGSVGSYKWIQTSGASCVLNGTNTSKLEVIAPTTGTYMFKLTVADIFGASSSDEVKVTVADVTKTATATIGQVYMDTIISGTATFKQKNNEDVTLVLDVTCPYKANKSVAVHFHMMPDCGGMAANAKGHWNPTNASHGKWGGAPGTFHIGDIGNISLDGSGHATYSVSTNLWNINGPDTSRNVIDRSIMVHSGIDTYSVQPSGNSGNRIGCGAIK